MEFLFLISGTGPPRVIIYVMDNAANRAAQYRKEAVELRRLADKELPGSALRDQFLALADDYDKLARQTETDRYQQRC
ncbi:MAG TPA: hypothetical protein VG651_00705 [Stellaceae bacterium]|nr:hypothetical protein [Stellaceae bacterium]